MGMKLWELNFFLPEKKSLWAQPSPPLFHIINSNQLDKIKKKSHIMSDL